MDIMPILRAWIAMAAASTTQTTSKKDGETNRQFVEKRVVKNPYNCSKNDHITWLRLRGCMRSPPVDWVRSTRTYCSCQWERELSYETPVETAPCFFQAMLASSKFGPSITLDHAQANSMRPRSNPATYSLGTDATTFD